MPSEKFSLHRQYVAGIESGVTNICLHTVTSSLLACVVTGAKLEMQHESKLEIISHQSVCLVQHVADDRYLFVPAGFTIRCSIS